MLYCQSCRLVIVLISRSIIIYGHGIHFIGKDLNVDRYIHQ